MGKLELHERKWIVLCGGRDQRKKERTEDYIGKEEAGERKV